MTLAELIASGRATVKLEEIVRCRAGEDPVLDLSRCSAYEAAANGELPFVFRVGRRYLCSVPAILQMLQIPLPDDWVPAGTFAERWQDDAVGSPQGCQKTPDDAHDADERADVVAFDQRRHKGSGPDRAQASPDRSRGGGRSSRSG